MAKKTLGRNAPCHCGSGRKYKQCHGAHSAAKQKRGKWIAIAIGGALLLAALSFLNALSNQSPDDGQPGRVWSPEHGHYH